MLSLHYHLGIIFLQLFAPQRVIWVMPSEIKYSSDRILIAACAGNGKVLCSRTDGLYRGRLATYPPWLPSLNKGVRLIKTYIPETDIIGGPARRLLVRNRNDTHR